MTRFLIAVALAALTATPFSTSVLAADVGVSLSIGQPGFFGRINIGGYPPPRVLYRQPIAIGRVPMNRPPIYLHVPPGHARQWINHCRDYNACDERVMFVQPNWYKREYVQRYQENQRGGQYNRQDQHRNGQGGQHRNNQQGRGGNR